jgi:anti-anti-sigma regulatory factor
MAKKMDKSTVEAIKQLLEQYNVNKNGRIVIDLENHLVSEYDDEDISDLMGIRGTISDERAKEWLKEIKEIRETW